MLHFVQINHILYVLYVFMLTYIQGMLSTLNTVIVSTFNSTIMSDGILQNPDHFKLCSGEGNINLHETMKYKNKHQLLGIKKKNIQAFLENNIQKGNSEIKQWLLWSHVKQLGASSISFTHYSHIITVNPLLTQACIHLLYVCTKAWNYTQTQTFLQHSCTGSLLSCAKRKMIPYRY